jgi:hypothetical protein
MVTGKPGKINGIHKSQTSSLISIIEDFKQQNHLKNPRAITVPNETIKKVGIMCFSFAMYVSTILQISLASLNDMYDSFKITEFVLRLTKNSFCFG